MRPAQDVPENSGLPLARTPLAYWHMRHGARLDEINSWQVPAVYSDENSEIAAARTGLAIADISFIIKVVLRGAGVAELTQSLIGNGPAEKPGGVAPLTADKSILACRLHADQLLVLGNPTGNDKLGQILSSAAKEKDEGGPPSLVCWSGAKQVFEVDATSAFACFWLFGPHTDELLRHISHFDVGALTPGSCAETGFAGVPTVLVRPPIPAMPSMRILTGWDLAEYVWEELFRAGQPWRISPLGLDGLDMLLSDRSPGAKKPSP
jgi:glycine cleavage system aminomethyltransferase T